MARKFNQIYGKSIIAQYLTLKTNMDTVSLRNILAKAKKRRKNTSTHAP